MYTGLASPNALAAPASAIASNITNIQTVDGAPPNLLLIVGPLLIGCLFSWCLYGVLFVQLYLYYLSFPQDKIIVKLTVYGLFIVDTFQSVAITDLAWAFLCKGWGDLGALRFTTWGFAIVPLVSGIVAAWVQLFFAWRINLLGGRGKRKWIWRAITLLIVLIALAQGAAGVAAGIRFIPLSDVTEFHIIYGSASTWLAGSAACDVLIAVSMVVLLSSAKKRAFGERSERLLTRLIRMTVETGVVTATAAVLDLGLFLGQADNNLHLLMALLLSKLYTNTLYATLNSRSQVFHTGDTELSEATSRGSRGSRGGGQQTSVLSSLRLPQSNPAGHGAQFIHVSRITEVQADSGEDRKLPQVDAIPMVSFPPPGTKDRDHDLKDGRDSASFA